MFFWRVKISIYILLKLRRQINGWQKWPSMRWSLWVSGVRFSLITSHPSVCPKHAVYGSLFPIWRGNNFRRAAKIECGKKAAQSWWSIGEIKYSFVCCLQKQVIFLYKCIFSIYFRYHLICLKTQKYGRKGSMRCWGRESSDLPVNSRHTFRLFLVHLLYCFVYNGHLEEKKLRKIFSH